MLGFILPNKVLFVFMGGAGWEGVCPSCVLCCMPCLLYDHASTPSRIINHALNTKASIFRKPLTEKHQNLNKKVRPPFWQDGRQQPPFNLQWRHKLLVCSFFYFQTHPARFFMFKRTILYGPLVFVLKRSSFAFFLKKNETQKTKHLRCNVSSTNSYSSCYSVRRT